MGKTGTAEHKGHIRDKQAGKSRNEAARCVGGGGIRQRGEAGIQKTGKALTWFKQRQSTVKVGQEGRSRASTGRPT